MPMKKDIKLLFEDSRTLEVYYGTTVRDVIREIADENVIALRVNGKVVDADYELTGDSYINYIYVGSKIGQRIYLKGLQYVYILAVKELYGDRAVVNIKHSLDRAIYTEIDMKRDVNPDTVSNIKRKMKEICNKDYPIRRVSVDREDAYDYLESLGEPEKMLNYKYITMESVTMYELNNEYKYFYYIVMPASTKILKRFDLTYVAPNGVALSYPINNVIPKFTLMPKVLNAFKSYEEHLAKVGIRYAPDINKLIIDNKISDFIQQNEILFDKNMSDLAALAVKNKTKAIFISGPSSSGKTTSSKKLAMYLQAMGKDPFIISTDDYFLNRVDSPKKPDGSYDFEILEALDIKLFNKQIKYLLDGKEVSMPTFNFITGEKEFKRKPIVMNSNQVLIVEGLHSISEKLNHMIPRKSKLKVYISPFTPIRIDRHNHISATDLRFLRRLVRDYKTRGYSADATLTMWNSMRSSEENNVYCYQREADVVINTSLAYELGVLKTYAEPLLYSVEPESANYEEAIRILKFLRCFFNIPSEYVPNLSVLREFIGNSYFE